MKRGEAERAIDYVRGMLARRESPEAIEAYLSTHHKIEPLQACHGGAHSNPFIDNCGVCAPRWGLVGERVRIT